jgi:hypothetical protein
MKGIVLSKRMLAAYGAFVVLFAAQLTKADSIELGAPGYGGTGCPAALAPQISISKGLLTVRYTNFILEDAAQSVVGRKNCSIRIPVHVAGGYRLAVQAAEFRGILRLPERASAQINSEVGFIGIEPIKLSQTFDVEQITQTVRLRGITRDLKFTNCGDDAMLALNTNVIYSKQSTVSGVRAQARVSQVQLVIEKCN